MAWNDVISTFGRRDVLLIVGLAFVFWIGVWPQFFLERMAPTLDRSAAAARTVAATRTVTAGGIRIADTNLRPTKDQ